MDATFWESELSAQNDSKWYSPRGDIGPGEMVGFRTEEWSILSCRKSVKSTKILVCVHRELLMEFIHTYKRRKQRQASQKEYNVWACNIVVRKTKAHLNWIWWGFEGQQEGFLQLLQQKIRVGKKWMEGHPETKSMQRLSHSVLSSSQFLLASPTV